MPGLIWIKHGQQGDGGSWVVSLAVPKDLQSSVVNMRISRCPELSAPLVPALPSALLDKSDGPCDDLTYAQLLPEEETAVMAKWR